MVRFTFKKGLRFVEKQRIWTLVRRLVSGKLQFEDEAGEITVITEEAIFDRWRLGQWSIDEHSLDMASNMMSLATPRDLASFPGHQQEQIERRLKYVEAFQGNESQRLEDLAITVARVSSEIGDDAPPCSTTVWRWAKKYYGTKCPTRLVDGRTRSGRKKNEVIQDIFIGVVNRIFLTPEKRPILEVYDELCRQIKIFNDSNQESIESPSRASVYRWIGELEQEIVDKARLGAYSSKRLYRPVLGQLKVTRILERIEVDHSPVDILVIDEETGLIRGRPWITVALDRYSRMIVGFYICFHEPSTFSIMECLKHAILPKAQFMSRFPDIKQEWPCYGIPDLLACDNGLDLHAEGLRLLCLEMGVGQLYCPAKEPEYKGAIERWFRTYSKGLIHQLPGTVFSNVGMRGEYDSEGHAAIDIHVLTHLITKWIVEIYHCQEHRNLKMSPLNKWKENSKKRIFELPAYPEQLDVLVGIPTSRTLFKYGLELDHLRYNSDELVRIRSRHGADKKLELQLKYYDDDSGYIHVFDPFNKVYVKVNAIDREYASGLPRDVHKLIIKATRDRNQDTTSTERLLEVKAEIQEIIAAAKKSKKMANRKRAAKLHGVDSRGRKAADISEQNSNNGKTRKLKTLPPPELDAGLNDDLPKFGESSSLFGEGDDE
jgi:putative transposase